MYQMHNINMHSHVHIHQEMSTLHAPMILHESVLSWTDDGLP